MSDRWDDFAACRDKPTEWFFPLRNTGRAGSGQLYDRARTICRNCPVIADCLDATLKAEGDASSGYRYGMFGGLTPNQRADLSGVNWRRKAS